MLMLFLGLFLMSLTLFKIKTLITLRRHNFNSGYTRKPSSIQLDE